MEAWVNAGVDFFLLLELSEIASETRRLAAGSRRSRAGSLRFSAMVAFGRLYHLSGLSIICLRQHQDLRDQRAVMDKGWF